MLVLVSISSTLAKLSSSSVILAISRTCARPASSPPMLKCSTPKPETSCPLESSTAALSVICCKSVESMPMIFSEMPLSSCGDTKPSGRQSSKKTMAMQVFRFKSSVSNARGRRLPRH